MYGEQMTDEGRARLPVEDPLSTDGKRSSWLASLVPRRIALWALRVHLRAPTRVVPGEPVQFQVSIRNRLPIAIAVKLPSSRLWGWAIDGVPEADERGFEPPAEPRTVRFGGRERRVFEGRWDGMMRRPGPDGDIWEPIPGSHTLSAYLAVTKPESSGVIDSSSVTVEPELGDSDIDSTA